MCAAIKNLDVADFSALDQQYMQQALELAEQAASMGEVPVGAVIVAESGEIIATGHNEPIGLHDPTAHAEIIALRAAANALNNYRLLGTTLYCTLEPCVMCAGAIIHARVKRVVYATGDVKAGAAGSVFDVLGTDLLNHQVVVDAGLLADPARALLQTFFQARRKANKTA
ncbi:MAG: tRNA adenosine(34) deaminase TadA [Gammaproteobacteria bacterium]